MTTPGPGHPGPGVRLFRRRWQLQLEGIHHVTAITADARRSVEFYAGTLGLRLVKKTVNFDAPQMYHLYYGDEQGSPGSVLTFFEAPGSPTGRAGAGMVHRLIWRVGSGDALDYWADRLAAAGTPAERDGDTLRFADPEGLGHELIVDEAAAQGQGAQTPDVAAEHALAGLHGVRAYSVERQASRLLLGRLGFERTADATFSVGEERVGVYIYDAPTTQRPLSGAGTVHHVAFACHDDDHVAWHELLLEANAAPTPVHDRTYFRSVYFREPSGVLFELATIGPGFTVDEPLDRLGDELQLPPQFERMRARLERSLRPVTNPRSAYQARS